MLTEVCSRRGGDEGQRAVERLFRHQVPEPLARRHFPRLLVDRLRLGNGRGGHFDWKPRRGRRSGDGGQVGRHVGREKLPLHGLGFDGGRGGRRGRHCRGHGVGRARGRGDERGRGHIRGGHLRGGHLRGEQLPVHVLLRGRHIHGLRRRSGRQADRRGGARLAKVFEGLVAICGRAGREFSEVFNLLHSIAVIGGWGGGLGLGQGAQKLGCLHVEILFHGQS